MVNLGSRQPLAASRTGTDHSSPSGMRGASGARLSIRSLGAAVPSAEDDGADRAGPLFQRADYARAALPSIWGVLLRGAIFSTAVSTLVDNIARRFGSSPPGYRLLVTFSLSVS